MSFLIKVFSAYFKIAKRRKMSVKVGKCRKLSENVGKCWKLSGSKWGGALYILGNLFWFISIHFQTISINSSRFQINFDSTLVYEFLVYFSSIMVISAEFWLISGFLVHLRSTLIDLTDHTDGFQSKQILGKFDSITERL